MKRNKLRVVLAAGLFGLPLAASADKGTVNSADYPPSPDNVPPSPGPYQSRGLMPETAPTSPQPREFPPLDYLSGTPDTEAVPAETQASPTPRAAAPRVAQPARGVPEAQGFPPLNYAPEGVTQVAPESGQTQEGRAESQPSVTAQTPPPSGERAPGAPQPPDPYGARGDVQAGYRPYRAPSPYPAYPEPPRYPPANPEPYWAAPPPLGYSQSYDYPLWGAAPDPGQLAPHWGPYGRAYSPPPYPEAPNYPYAPPAQYSEGYLFPQ